MTSQSAQPRFVDRMRELKHGDIPSDIRNSLLITPGIKNGITVAHSGCAVRRNWHFPLGQGLIIRVINGIGT